MTCAKVGMDTTVTEVAPDIYRLSTFLEDADLLMNQFLVAGPEALLFHTACVPCSRPSPIPFVV